MGGITAPTGARKSLADLRANPPKSRAERSLTVCLAPNLVAEVMALTEELSAVAITPMRDEEGNAAGPPRKLGQAGDPRETEIRSRLEVMLAEMANYEGELRLRATTDGEWRNWVNAHPPRAEDEKGHKRDQDVAFGFCNADDLIDSLGTYAYSWNAEMLTDGDWAILADSISGPDLKQAATAVVAMHESHVDIPKWRTNLSASLGKLSASDSPATSASAPDDSMAGSPGGGPNTSTSTTPMGDADDS